uniref:Uncharacterized protein n=1 Tax=Romanomermis culicivorax TaxID=13658 RepID=A0A915HJ00_ROMCU
MSTEHVILSQNKATNSTLAQKNIKYDIQTRRKSSLDFISHPQNNALIGRTGNNGRQFALSVFTGVDNNDRPYNMLVADECRNTFFVTPNANASVHRTAD